MAVFEKKGNQYGILSNKRAFQGSNKQIFQKYRTIQVGIRNLTYPEFQTCKFAINFLLSIIPAELQCHQWRQKYFLTKKPMCFITLNIRVYVTQSIESKDLNVEHNKNSKFNRLILFFLKFYNSAI